MKKRLLPIALSVMALVGGAPVHAAIAVAPVPMDIGERNVALVKSFLQDVRQAMRSRNPAQVRVVAERYMASGYIQHSAEFEPGREGYIAGITKGLTAPPLLGPGGLPRDLHFIGNRDFVVWMSEVSPPGGKPKYVFNMFRIANGKFVEHWDAM